MWERLSKSLSDFSRLLEQRSTLILLTIAVFLWSLVQVIFIVDPRDHLYSDMQGYVERGLRLAEGAPSFPFDGFYPPGTSFVYSLFFRAAGDQDGLLYLALANALALSFSSVFAALAGYRLFKSRAAPFAVLLVTLLYWPFLAIGSFFLAEPFYCFFTYAGFLALVIALERGGKTVLVLLSGLLLGLATLFRTQGIVTLLAFAIALFILVPRDGRGERWKAAAKLISGAALVLLCQNYYVSRVSGERGFMLSANDAFNTYLGQSRRAAIGCWDQEAGFFYIFHNNNTGLGYNFLPLEILPVSILDRSYFKSKARELWAEDPFRQLVVSAHSIVELFSPSPEWPLRNVPWTHRPATVVQWGFVILVLTPAYFSLSALSALAGAAGSRRAFKEVLLLALPVLGIIGLASVSMGQPRYLLPYVHFLTLLSIPAYREYRTRSAWTLSRNLPALLIAAVLAVAAVAVRSAYDRYVPVFSPGEEVTYEHPPIVKERGEDKIIWWVDVGKDNAPLTSRVELLAPVYVHLGGFMPAAPWNRKVSWHIDGANGAKMSIGFPRNSATSVLFYLTDGDTYWRASVISTGSNAALAEQLFDGKWVSLPLTEAERDQGRVEVTFSKLTGDSVSVSGLALAGPSTGREDFGEE